MTTLADLPGWPWPSEAGELERLQVALAERADVAPRWEARGGPAEPGEQLPLDLTAAGVYVTYPSGVAGPGEAGEPICAAAVLMRSGEVIADAVERGQTCGPYIGGLLALRCGPLLERSVRALPQRPDLLVVDATGRDHPRRAGLALHLGAALGVPTVGITNRALLAEAAPVADRRGAASALALNGELVGYAVRTAGGVNPVLAHAAWRTSPELALRVALALTGRYRTPEPLRRARTLARVARSTEESRSPAT